MSLVVSVNFNSASNFGTALSCSRRAGCKAAAPRPLSSRLFPSARTRYLRHQRRHRHARLRARLYRRIHPQLAAFTLVLFGPLDTYRGPTTVAAGPGP